MSAKQDNFFELAGADGLFTLLLSNLLIICTAGISWLWHLREVFRHASKTPSMPAAPLPLTLVLGLRLQDNQVTDIYAARLNRALIVLQTNRTSEIMLLGGRNGENQLSEAECGRDWLIAHGVPPGRIHIEDFSRHTLENLRLARQKLGERNLSAAILVTSRYHLARSHALAKGLGINHSLCAAEDQLELSALHWRQLLVESYFLHWYRIGWWWSHLTRNHHSLSRIR